MSLSIASSLKGFTFDTLLFGAIKAEKLNDGEGTEHDPLEGTGFEPVNIPSSVASASHSPTINYTTPAPSASTSRPPSPSPLPAIMARDGNADDSNSETASDTNAPTLAATRKRKWKSKSKVTYQKLVYKKCRAADGQCKKDSLDPEINSTPSLRERRVASSTPINIPIFSLDTKAPAKTGYVAVRDAHTSKRVYRLGELVGETLRFKFNLIEWDGK